jgi:hypothetical protein
MSDMLDDMPDDNLRSKLRNYAENPDDDLWKKIQSGMVDKGATLQNRLSGYREQPDDAVWSRVNRGLRLHYVFQYIDRAGQVVGIAALLLLCLVAFIDKGKPISKVRDGFISTEIPDLSTSSNEGRQLIEPSASGKNISSNKARHDRITTAQNAVGTTMLHQDERSTNRPINLPALNLEKVTTSVQYQTIDESVVKASTLAIDSFISKNAANENTSQVKIAEQTNDASSIVSKSQFTNINTKTDSVAPIQGNNLNQAAFKNDSLQDTQQPSKDNKKKLRLNNGLYALVMPTFGYQAIEPLKNDNVLVQSLQKVSAFSGKRLGIRAEIGYEKFLSQKLAVQFGLLYFQRKQTISYSFSSTEQIEVDHSSTDSLSYIVKMTKQHATFEYELKNIGVLAGISYTTRTGRFVHRIGLASELQKSLVKRKQSELVGQQGMYLFGDAYYRLVYPMSKHFDLMLQPTLNYSLKVDDRIDAPFYVKPYGIGLNFGAYFHF